MTHRPHARGPRGCLLGAALLSTAGCSFDLDALRPHVAPDVLVDGTTDLSVFDGDEPTDTPVLPELPSLDVRLDAGDGAVVLDARDASDGPFPPDGLDVPDGTGTFDALDAPDVRDAPVTFDVPDVPDVPTVFDARDVFDAPDVRDVPDVPDVPDTAPAPCSIAGDTEEPRRVEFSVYRPAGIASVTYPRIRNCHTLSLRSEGSTFEWARQSGRSFVQGTVSAGLAGDVCFPHDQPFTLTLSRAGAGLVGWVHARERGCDLAITAFEGAPRSVAIGRAELLLDVATVGTAATAGSVSFPSLALRSTGNVVEWSFETAGTYMQGELPVGGTSSVPLVRGQPFTVTLARPGSSRIGAAHCREGSGTVACAVAETGTNVAVGSGLAILDVSGLGSVRTSGPGTQLTLVAASGVAVSWTLASGEMESSGEVLAGGMGSIPAPHYRTFVLTIARPERGLLGATRCRENDGRFVCLAGRSFVP